MECQVCERRPGELATVRFQDPQTEVTIRLCDTCRTSFAADSQLVVTDR